MKGISIDCGKQWQNTFVIGAARREHLAIHLDEKRISRLKMMFHEFILLS